MHIHPLRKEGMEKFSETRADGTSITAKDGVVWKKHSHPSTYHQERFFYDLLLPYKFSFMPEWVRFQDLKLELEMPDCGKQLEEISANDLSAPLTSFLPGVLACMEQVWGLNKKNIDHRYSYDYSRMSSETADFFCKKYEVLFNRIGPLMTMPKGQFMDLLTKKLADLFGRNRDAHIIHFDLFAGNILMDNESQIKIVDWSRARQASLVNEFAIIYAKLELTKSQAQSDLDGISMKFGIDFSDIEMLGFAYLLLRKSKNNTTGDNNELNSLVGNFVENYLR